MKVLERFLKKKRVIELIYIFPLINIVFIGIALKEFADFHNKIIGICEVRYLFTVVVCLLFVNLIANFIGLILYFYLSNRIKSFLQTYKKHKKQLSSKK